jgi:hypothetical protein
MAQDDYPPDPATWRTYARIEQTTIARAARATFTTPSAVRFYQERYPEKAAALRLLENGYEESVFAGRSAERGAEGLHPGRLTLLHSGVVYPDERNPVHLFAALAALKTSDPGTFSRLIIRFRAPGHTDLIRALTERHGVESAVEVLPPIPYGEAIDEMCRADGLLLLQASNCNAQIPAKFYEYVRAQRPILLLTDPAGDTAAAARRVGVTALAKLDDTPSIEHLLQTFCSGVTEAMRPHDGSEDQTSRRARTHELVQLLNEISPAAADA